MSSLREKVMSLNWYQQIDLGGGLITPGQRPGMWDVYRLPQSMEGLSVLDVGSWDGYFAFEAEKRGARKVVALDIWGKTYDSGHGVPGDETFKLAKDVLRSNVIQVVGSVYDVTPVLTGTFSVVLFPQVFYHLKHPHLALERLAKVTEQWLFLETMLDAQDYGRPAMVYYPKAELNNDASNWWGPNRACVEAMLLTVGFSSVELIWKEATRAAFVAYKL